ncbi:MAG: hypothetical protein WD058_09475 [Dehalococcoidia bacterium]
MKDFTDPQVRNILEQLCLEALLWGFDRPAAFTDWYQLKMKGDAHENPRREEAGLQIDAPPPLDRFFAISDELLSAYEAEIGSLRPIPERLLDDARSLGRTIA